MRDRPLIPIFFIQKFFSADQVCGNEVAEFSYSIMGAGAELSVATWNSVCDGAIK